ncbi:MAG: diacylglycerol kinase family lipid kinase, partial [Lachnospiraceae bacterium]|nr:diacylglycerol kinase family lipid kinase [Lachnospiraceae bacterium]
AYILEGINRLPENIRFNIPMKIKTDVFEEEGNYVFGAIHNATSIGGFSLNNGQVELNDGMFEMILIKAPQNLLELSQITQGLLSGNFDSPLISFHQIKSATITSDTFVAWTLDGEYGGKAKNVEFNVIPSAIQINV